MRRTAVRTALFAVATLAATSLVPISASAAPVTDADTTAASEATGPEFAIEGAELVSTVTARDGSVTMTYDNGDWLKLGPIESTSATGGVLAKTSQQSRKWTASYSAGLTADYFHHDGGTIKNVTNFTSCGITQKMYLSVASSWGVYTQQGATKDIPCAGAAPTWTSPEGNKKWRIYDPNTSDRYFPNQANGTIYWQD